MQEQKIFFDPSTPIGHYYDELIGISEWTSEEHEFQHIQRAINRIKNLRDNQNQKSKDIVENRNKKNRESKNIKNLFTCL